uniref:Secreted protein n=1 Tax=Arion vulgaris TaxID=1028688 RepID=A0A0B6ZN81_9EUPU
MQLMKMFLVHRSCLLSLAHRKCLTTTITDLVIQDQTSTIQLEPLGRLLTLTEVLVQTGNRCNSQPAP